MSTRNVKHEARSTSFWNGTVTFWCGPTMRRRDLERVFGSNCPACKRAKKQHRKGGRR